MLKTRRMVRYSNLRRVYFTKFEAIPLSKVNPNITPYFRDLMKQRAELAAKSFKLGKTPLEFENQIKELYRINNWFKLNRRGDKIADPWKMFRNFEDKFKQKTPAYNSPWQKRQKNMRDFVARLERSIKRESGHERS